MRWFYPIAALVVLALALSPFYLLGREELQVAPDQVVAYGTYGSKVRTLDPATCGDTTSASVQGNIYEGLYTYFYLKRPPEIRPQLARGLPEISEDKLTYTIRLKRGVRFHRNPCFGVDPNGRPKTREVTAHDFVLQFKRICDSHVSATRLSLPLIYGRIAGVSNYRDQTKGFAKYEFQRYDLPLEGVRALDDYTLEITLERPFPQLIYVLAMSNYCPFPKEIIPYYFEREAGEPGRPRELRPLSERLTEINDERMAIGTGAYRLHTWQRASKIIFVRNGDYRKVTFPTAEEMSPEFRTPEMLAQAGRRVPFVDVRRLTYVAESIPMWKLFMAKQVDTTGVPEELYETVITPAKELEADLAGQGVTLDKYSSPVVYWYAFNLDDKVIGASRSLRQAMQLCYNVKEHIEVLFNGRGKPARTYIPSSFEGYDEALSPYTVYDLERARQKLADARDELVAAGVIAEGEPIPTIHLDLGDSEYHRKMGSFALSQFRKLGLDIEIDMMDWPTLQEKVHSGQSQMYSMGWHADYPDPENFLQLYYGPNIERGTNSTNYRNPEFDALYDKVRVMMPSPERTKLYVRMLDILNEDCPNLLLSEPVSFVLRHSWVHNAEPHPIGYGFGKYTRIDVEARRKEGGP